MLPQSLSIPSLSNESLKRGNRFTLRPRMKGYVEESHSARDTLPTQHEKTCTQLSTVSSFSCFGDDAYLTPRVQINNSALPSPPPPPDAMSLKSGSAQFLPLDTMTKNMTIDANDAVSMVLFSGKSLHKDFLQNTVPIHYSRLPRRDSLNAKCA
uniref:Uncharacterized protein n=1 Tax=Trieres chinensis TaxID=1514140 RepID=A0A7S1ZLE3_TRICV|mmetsp:Transcript_27845/g.57061  ORF Transcript_27845/g.57061 Transcript_27845/m.57061 type:complete len:154 (+) Transcript_27845:77-538(+)